MNWPRIVSRIDFSQGPEGCWEWKAATYPNGYGMYREGGNHRVHRLTWSLRNGDIPKGLSILHSCDNRKCCNPSHLWAGTQAENIADMMSKGRVCRGSRKPQAKLTEAQVAEMRDLYSHGGVQQKELAERFGISTTTAWKILNHRLWKEA